MNGKAGSRPDALLLVSLLVVILLHPILDRGDLRNLVLTGLTFVLLIFSTLKLAQLRRWVWPSILLMSGSVIFELTDMAFPNRAFLAIKFGFLTAFYGLTVVGLFSYLKQARPITNGHLFTAISIYLLLGMAWFALYSGIDALYPDAILEGGHPLAARQSDLLYFSLITITTVGYGYIVPRDGEVRMLAALEAVMGILYMAITVGILVSGYQRRGSVEETRTDEYVSIFVGGPQTESPASRSKPDGWRLRWFFEARRFLWSRFRRGTVTKASADRS